jgi:hypothetical protein
MWYVQGGNSLLTTVRNMLVNLVVKEFRLKCQYVIRLIATPPHVLVLVKCTLYVVVVVME